ncbi:5363_t:CDS:2, partial [Racocetra fulgida]
NIESIHPISKNISTSSQIENINNTSKNEEIIIATSQNDNIAEISVELQSATVLNEVEQEFLRKFRTKMTNDLTAFRDFIVHHNIVANALYWLKANNHYYADIIINNEVLESLPEDDDDSNIEIEDEITCSFVSFLLLTDCENVAINNAFDI